MLGRQSLCSHVFTCAFILLWQSSLQAVACESIECLREAPFFLQLQLNKSWVNSSSILADVNAGKNACSHIVNTNIVYIKVPKSASTTAAGVTRRIAARHGLNGVSGACQWMTEIGEPGIWAKHGALDRQDFGNNLVNEAIAPADCSYPSMADIEALRLPTFIWTTIRDPAERAMSLYYHQHEHRLGFNKSKAQWLTDYMRGGGSNQFRYIRSSAQDTLNDVFNTYDFIAVTERFDDSMVVLAAMLNISLTDALYAVDAKKGRSHPRSEESDDVKRILDDEFPQANDLDYELFKRANNALDLKIAEMQLEDSIKEYKHVLDDVQRACRGFCGEADDGCCYFRDEGCGYQCLDRYSHRGAAASRWCRDK